MSLAIVPASLSPDPAVVRPGLRHRPALGHVLQEDVQLRQEEANMIAEISGAQASSKNLTDKIRRLGPDSVNPKRVTYKRLTR